MAKGEGVEQYSNASLLNKTVNSDGIELARKVRYVHSFVYYKRMHSLTLCKSFYKEEHKFWYIYLIFLPYKVGTVPKLPLIKNGE